MTYRLCGSANPAVTDYEWKIEKSSRCSVHKTDPVGLQGILEKGEALMPVKEWTC